MINWLANSGELADVIADTSLSGLYVTWLGMPGYPGLPPLAAIDCAKMIRLWPSLVLVELVPGRRLRYRVAGPDVVKQLGRDIAGLYLDEVATGSSLEVLNALYDLTAGVRTAVYSRTRTRVPTNATDLAVHRLMLPMSNERRGVDMILAAQTFETGAGIGPEPDFQIGAQKRSEWNCRAWIDANHAA